MRPKDQTLSVITNADPARHHPLTEQEAQDLASRVRARVLTAEAGSVQRDRADRPRVHWYRRLGALASFAVIAASALAVVAVAATFVLVGHLGHAASPQLTAQRQQAQRLYAPVATFYRSTTPSQRALPYQNPAIKAETAHLTACQAPYSKQMFAGLIGNGPRYKLYRLYEDGTLLQSYQERIAPLTPQLTTLADAWTHLDLTDPLMQSFARAVAQELYTTLRAPHFDSCAFIRAIAAHHFSLTWARHSTWGRAASRYSKSLNSAGDKTDMFWAYFYRGSGNSTHVFTNQQLHNLANLPGELG